MELIFIFAGNVAVASGEFKKTELCTKVRLIAYTGGGILDILTLSHLSMVFCLVIFGS